MTKEEMKYLALSERTEKTKRRKTTKLLDPQSGTQITTYNPLFHYWSIDEHRL